VQVEIDQDLIANPRLRRQCSKVLDGGGVDPDRDESIALAGRPGIGGRSGGRAGRFLIETLSLGVIVSW
jgi:hypothetical protein